MKSQHKKPRSDCTIGGSGGGHRYCSTLGKDFTHSALERYLDQRCSREIYGKNGHLWCKLICGKKGPTVIVNVPGPFQEAKAAMVACLKALAEEGGVEDICKAMAEAVYAQYPVGQQKHNGPALESFAIKLVTEEGFPMAVGGICRQGTGTYWAERSLQLASLHFPAGIFILLTIPLPGRFRKRQYRR